MPRIKLLSVRVQYHVDFNIETTRDHLEIIRKGIEKTLKEQGLKCPDVMFTTMAVPEVKPILMPE